MLECYNECDNDTTCMAKCNRDLPDCIISCPCQDGCPFGCYKCDNPICHIGETTVATTIETTEPPTTIPPPSYALVVVNSYDGNMPVMLSDTGRPIPGVGVTLDEYVESHGSCLAVYRGTTYLFGGVQQKRQISRLNDCHFEWIGHGYQLF